MGRIIRWAGATWRWVSHASNVQFLWQMFATSLGIGGMTGWLARVAGQPLWADILIGAAVAALVGVALVSISSFLQRRRHDKPSPLYLEKLPHSKGRGGTDYIVTWGHEVLDIDFRETPRSFPPGKAVEPSPKFSVFNAGPEDVRHLQFRWFLEGVDLHSLIDRHQLFGDTIDRFTSNHIRLVCVNQGVTVPLATDLSAPPIPLLRAGRRITVEPPTAITKAYCVCALAMGKEAASVRSETIGHTVQDAMDDFEQSRLELPTLSIEMRYMAGDQRIQQRYDVTAWVIGNVAAISGFADDDNTFRAMEGGIAAWILSMEANPHESV